MAKKEFNWKKIIAWAFYFSVAVFFALYLKNLDFETILNLKVKFRFILLALFLSLVSRMLMPFAWIILIEDFGGKIKSYSQLCYVYAKSWLGRYIPGKVTWIGGKIFFGLEQGIGKGILTISSFLEASIQILSGLLLGLILVFLSGNLTKINPKIQLFSLAALITLVPLLSPPIFNRLMRTGYRTIKQKKLNPQYKLRSNSLIKVGFLFAFLQLVGGIAFGAIAQSIGFSVNIRSFLFLSGTIILSVTIGMLAFFAPSGIGMREGTQACLLALVMPKEQAIIVILFSRMLAVLTDILFFVINWFIIKNGGH